MQKPALCLALVGRLAWEPMNSSSLIRLGDQRRRHEADFLTLLTANALTSSSGIVEPPAFATNKAIFITLIDESQMHIFYRIRRLNGKPMRSLLQE